MSEGGNPWRTRGSRTVYDNPWIRVREDEVVSPGGQDARYGVISFKNTAIGVVPLAADGSVHLVGQWRYALGQFSWEIPEGGGRKDADPLEEAKRELLEETGLAAAHWRLILRLHISNSITDEAALIYLATGLSRADAPRPEHSEADMKNACVPFAELLRRVTGGEITDGMTAAGVLRAHQMAVQGELDPDLAAAVLGRSR